MTKKYLIVSAVVIILLIIGLGGWWYYTKVYSRPVSTGQNETNPTVKIIFPNNNEVLKIGSKYKIQWTIDWGNVKIANLTTISLVDPTKQGELSHVNTIALELPASLQTKSYSYDWTIPKTISPGSYKIDIYTFAPDIYSVGDQSDIAFSIIKSNNQQVSPIITYASSSKTGALSMAGFIISGGDVNVKGQNLGDHCITDCGISVYVGDKTGSNVSVPSSEWLQFKAPQLQDGKYDLYIINNKTRQKSNTIQITVGTALK